MIQELDCRQVQFVDFLSREFILHIAALCVILVWFYLGTGLHPISYITRGIVAAVP